MHKPIYNLILFLLSVLLLALSSCQAIDEKQETDDQPNIIYILADDLGYGDLGVYGQQKIETPSIDLLAEEGMVFTQHYSSAPVCAPARYMLLTGKHAGHAHIRGNDEWGERGNVWDYKAVAKDSTLEGQRPLPKETQTFAKKLQQAGYKTAVFGKWGLGAPGSESTPLKVGFDYFFGYNDQRQAHTYYPLHLYRNEHRVYLDNDTVPPHTKLAKGADPKSDESYKPFNQKDYTPTLIFEDLMQYIEQNKDEKFFIYWASPIPHVALQAPKEWVEHYVKKFGEEEPYLGATGYFPHKNPRAAYAAMISYLDENVGKLITKLKDEGIYDNTLIIFTSDNGPSAHGGVDADFFNSAGKFSNNYGRTKGFVYEGGIRVPMIATWKKKIKVNSKTDHPSVQYDVYATLDDIIGFNDSKPTDGISFYPTLIGQEQPSHPFLFWEFPEYNGQIAIRMDDWKVIWKNLQKKESERIVELYNLATDPEEKNNLADEHPEIIEKAITIFQKEHQTPDINRFKIKAIEEGYIGKID